MEGNLFWVDGGNCNTLCNILVHSYLAPFFFLLNYAIKRALSTHLDTKHVWEWTSDRNSGLQLHVPGPSSPCFSCWGTKLQVQEGEVDGSSAPGAPLVLADTWLPTWVLPCTCGWEGSPASSVQQVTFPSCKLRDWEPASSPTRGCLRPGHPGPPWGLDLTWSRRSWILGRRGRILFLIEKWERALQKLAQSVTWWFVPLGPFLC